MLLIDESHNFRNDKSNRYLALDEAIQRNGGRGRDGQRKKVILLSATPINNDLYDLANQIRLFTQSEADYFRDAGIGDLNAYFRRGQAIGPAGGRRAGDGAVQPAGRDHGPQHAAVHPGGVSQRHDQRQARRVPRPAAAHGRVQPGGDLRRACTRRSWPTIERLSLAPYQLESYRKKSAIRDEQEHEWETGREVALVGIFKTRFLKRLESSVFAFRESLRRALVFEETYLDYLLDGRVVSSRDFQKLMRFLARDEEDEPAAGSVAEDLDAVDEARQYLDSLPKVDLNQYDLRKLAPRRRGGHAAAARAVRPARNRWRPTTASWNA